MCVSVCACLDRKGPGREGKVERGCLFVCAGHMSGLSVLLACPSRGPFVRINTRFATATSNLPTILYDQAPPLSHRVSALQAFWPALQAAAGDLAAAERTYRLLFELWEEHEALPDFYDVFAQR